MGQKISRCATCPYNKYQTYRPRQNTSQTHYKIPTKSRIIMKKTKIGLTFTCPQELALLKKYSRKSTLYLSLDLSLETLSKLKMCDTKLNTSKQLRTLDISDHPDSDRELRKARAVLLILKRCKRLSKVNFKQLTRMRNSSKLAEHFLPVLKRLHSLCTLTISLSRIPDSNNKIVATPLYRSLKYLHSLSTLTLQFDNVSNLDAIIEVPPPSIYRLKSLSSLTLRFENRCSISTKAMNSLSAWLRNTSMLCSLDLSFGSYVSIQEESLSGLFESIGLLSHLSSLVLRLNTLSMAENLEAALQRLELLSYLKLALTCKERPAKFISSLRLLPSLQTISLEIDFANQSANPLWADILPVLKAA